MPLAEIRDGVVIGMLVGRQEAKGHIFMGSDFDLSRAIDFHAVEDAADVVLPAPGGSKVILRL